MSLLRKEKPGQVIKKKIPLSKVKLKIASFCAYQERCPMEVKDKLEDMGLSPEQMDSLILKLTEEGYLNEIRFANAFVLGRFSQKKWGKVRIRQELKMKEISELNIQAALKEIDEDDYLTTLKLLAKRKWDLTKEEDVLKKKAKVYRFLIFKGFEFDLIKNVVEDIIQETS